MYHRFWHKSTAPNYGNCFTFNAEYNPLDELSPRSSTLTGALNGSSYTICYNFSDSNKKMFISGLTVELFVDQLNYMKGDLSQSAGIRMVVHNPDSYPMTDEFGLDVMPGTSSSITLQMNDIIRLEHPHPTDCYSSWDQTDLDSSLMSESRPRYAKSVRR